MPPQSSRSVLLWVPPDAQAQALVDTLSAAGADVLTAGPGAQGLSGGRRLDGAGSRGAALQAARTSATGDVTVLVDLAQGWGAGQIDAAARLVERDEAEVATARRSELPLGERALAQLARRVTDVEIEDPLPGLWAVRTSVLREPSLSSEGAEVDVELLVKLAAQRYRFGEVPVDVVVRPRPPSELWSLSRRLVAYATTLNDTDNAHEGYNTLARMEAGAPNYNTWLGERFNAHAGRRVLEIGAGIGTITSLLAKGREQVTALEVDEFYVKRLKNRFRGMPHVKPYLSDVAIADWQALRKERFDTIVLSNVLEHIPDDAGAVRRFAQVLEPGGRVLILVPALPVLFGALDEAVGHFRRYTPKMLRDVLEPNGFTVERLEWMNLLGIPGWLVNGRLLGRRAMPPLQLRLYDQLAPYLARAESKVSLPVGMSLFCVARLG